MRLPLRRKRSVSAPAPPLQDAAFDLEDALESLLNDGHGVVEEDMLQMQSLLHPDDYRSSSSDEELDILEALEAPTPAAMPDADHLAALYAECGAFRKEVRVYDIATGKQLGTIHGPLWSGSYKATCRCERHRSAICTCLLHSRREGADEVMHHRELIGCLRAALDDSKVLCSKHGDMARGLKLAHGTRRPFLACFFVWFGNVGLQTRLIRSF